MAKAKTERPASKGRRVHNAGTRGNNSWHKPIVWEGNVKFPWDTQWNPQLLEKKKRELDEPFNLLHEDWPEHFLAYILNNNFKFKKFPVEGSEGLTEYCVFDLNNHKILSIVSSRDIRYAFRKPRPNRSGKRRR